MRITILKDNRQIPFILPKKVYGNYWLKDLDSNNKEENIINVQAVDGRWCIASNQEVHIVTDKGACDTLFLEEGLRFQLVLAQSQRTLSLLCSSVYMSEQFLDVIPQNGIFCIGNEDGCAIQLNFTNISQVFKLTFENKCWSFEVVDKASLVYVNDIRNDNGFLSYGDVLCYGQLKLVVMPQFIILSSPMGMVKVNSQIFKPRAKENKELFQEKEEIKDIELYSPNEYFHQAPRFITAIEPLKMEIDPPPSKEPESNMPLIYSLGPMVTMGMSSLVMSISSINSMLSQGKTFGDVMPTVIVALAMLASMLLWPSLIKKFEQKEHERKEKLRQEKYRTYIDEKRQIIKNNVRSQHQILIENYISLEKCKEIILNKKKQLWERKIDQDDFLTLRLGMGTIPLNADIHYPEEHFTLEEDALKEIIGTIVNENKMLENVPITESFVEKNITAVVGDEMHRYAFLDNLLFQMFTFHSYTDLKLIVLTRNPERFEALKKLPHVWSNNREVRFFATDQDEAKELSLYLEKECYHRKVDESGNNRNLDYKSFAPYYMIITDDYQYYRNIDIVEDTLNQKENVGFSIVIVNEKLSNLPAECTNFINVTETTSGFFESELTSDKQQEFVADLFVNDTLDAYCYKLANIPIELDNEETNEGLPRVLGFLEMYQVGNIEQLNPVHRWQSNNPTISLQAPVGVDSSGSLVKLDLHEKSHGPHGLIAGMTGSGKSEFIITYILSLAINYHPDEVSFILIDYKGGGLAGVFENNEVGIHLPHLVGTITNLDKAELNRSLVSIQSELRRRQQIFNEVRDQLNAGTIDIYKYQTLYRTGEVKEPLPHLFIISDEFAELKSQQPEFMDQLISTARIGRSLGVHLILATQKPAGVVNDQIWSNSRFRVCLKVQDKADSQDMIQCPDAALLTTTGRFYLQVGYNELFTLGQSAWTGISYQPTDKPQKKIDESIDLIDSIGSIIEEVDDTKKSVVTSAQGEELTNIVTYLSRLAEEQKIVPKSLWLPPLKEDTLLTTLEEKYSYVPSNEGILALIGEYDDPMNQRQDLLSLSLTEGDTILYGTSGSGVETLLQTMILSVITHYSPEKVGFYLLDFGSESLRMFEGFPQIGDIVLSSEEEKLTNLLKYLKDEIEIRKSRLLPYNGDLSLFHQKEPNELPYIVVVINGYETFYENYETLEDELMLLTREGNRYGIFFFVTASSTNGIRYRMRQNFTNAFTLQLNQEEEYALVFGNTKNVLPSQVYGRGLIKLDEIYEFQTAIYCSNEDLLEKVALLKQQEQQKTSYRTKKVPILPNRVTRDFLRSSFTGLNHVPIGVQSENLEIMELDLKKQYTTMVTSYDVMNVLSFTRGLLRELMLLTPLDYVILDAEGLLENDKVLTANNCYKTNFGEELRRLYDIASKEQNIYKEANYDKKVLANNPFKVIVIVGLATFLKKINSSDKTIFENLMKMAKDLEQWSFILVDAIDNFKKEEYNEWYKVAIDPAYGIWIGNGMMDQFTLKINRTTKDLMEEIKDDFGYQVKRGIPERMKVLEEEENG